MSRPIYYMVHNKAGGRPYFVHNDIDSAQSEAIRLARGNQGTEFYVLAAIRCVYSPLAPVEVVDCDELPF